MRCTRLEKQVKTKKPQQYPVAVAMEKQKGKANESTYA